VSTAAVAAIGVVLGIFEIIEMTDTLASAITRGVDEEEIRRIASTRE